MTDETVRQGIRDHIKKVHSLMVSIAIKLDKRGEKHDATKLQEPEFSAFVEFTPKLAESVYGSDEYRDMLSAMGPTLEHHYAHNRHHPNHHARGVDDMDLIDIIEMLCDWKAASSRTNGGNIVDSLAINAERYNISSQLKNILYNSLWMVE